MSHHRSCCCDVDPGCCDGTPIPSPPCCTDNPGSDIVVPNGTASISFSGTFRVRYTRYNGPTANLTGLMDIPFAGTYGLSSLDCFGAWIPLQDVAFGTWEIEDFEGSPFADELVETATGTMAMNIELPDYGSGDPPRVVIQMIGQHDAIEALRLTEFHVAKSTTAASSFSNTVSTISPTPVGTPVIEHGVRDTIFGFPKTGFYHANGTWEKRVTGVDYTFEVDAHIEWNINGVREVADCNQDHECYDSRGVIPKDDIDPMYLSFSHREEWRNISDDVLVFIVDNQFSGPILSASDRGAECEPFRHATVPFECTSEGAYIPFCEVKLTPEGEIDRVLVVLARTEPCPVGEWGTTQRIVFNNSAPGSDVLLMFLTRGGPGFLISEQNLEMVTTITITNCRVVIQASVTHHNPDAGNGQYYDIESSMLLTVPFELCTLNP